jgi:hypothetical protein
VEDVTLAMGVLAAFATIVGGYATLRANVQRNTTRVEALEAADTKHDERLSKLEKWKSYEAGLAGREDPTITR